MPLLISLALLSKASNKSTVNTFLGPEAIWVSSDGSTSFPIPNTNTAAPLLWRRDEATSRGVYGPSSVVCLPVVITKTGYKARKGKNSNFN